MSWERLFRSTYTGSMYGSGPMVFALWPYIIAHIDYRDGTVELNPQMVAATIGSTIDEVVKAVAFLSGPDEKSRTKEEQGRRIVRLGEFLFRVVNYEKYRAVRDAESKREYDREYRARKRQISTDLDKSRRTSKSSTPTPSEDSDSDSHEDEYSEDTRSDRRGVQRGDSQPSVAQPEVVSTSAKVEKPVRPKNATSRDLAWTPARTPSNLAAEHGSNPGEWQAFCDYHDSKGSRFKDWDAAWRTWLRNAKRFGSHTNGRSGVRETVGERNMRRQLERISEAEAQESAEEALKGMRAP